jgi:hypothetical protein
MFQPGRFQRRIQNAAGGSDERLAGLAARQPASKASAHGLAGAARVANS